VILSTTAVVTDLPAGSAASVVTGIGTVPGGPTLGKSNGGSSTHGATVDAALNSIATENALVSSAVGLTNVGDNGSTTLGVTKKKS